MIRNPGVAQQLQQLLRAGSTEPARAVAGRVLTELLGESVGDVEFTLDAYSLNSVSGTFRSGSGSTLFFKFHTEEGEEDSVDEYYQAELLARAGLPVDVPVAYSATPGNQIVVYPVRHESRMSDVCIELEQRNPLAAALPEPLADAQRELDAQIGRVLVQTLGPPDPASATAGIHQLFHHRLVTGGVFPGGRFASWYLGASRWREVAGRTWVIDGVAYRLPLSDIVVRTEELLRPAALAAGWITTAHGDDHQGNIWVVAGPGGPTLQLFDPAFASDCIPALLAPIKATYHNVFAHPFWLYHPESVSAAVTFDVGEVVSLGTAGSGELSPLRRTILDSLTEEVWVPLLRAMRARDALPVAWRETVRSGLVACPLLVTNLLADSRPTAVQYLGLANVVRAGAEPVDGSDPVSRWLDRVQEALG